MMCKPDSSAGLAVAIAGVFILFVLSFSASLPREYKHSFQQRPVLFSERLRPVRMRHPTLVKRQRRQELIFLSRGRNSTRHEES
jgi:hypothetical protein